MPNAIKYNTSAESLALKDGDFWIGTNDVSKAPTQSSGFYNGITPPAGGYTIYQNKASDGPSIVVANNDSELISITNSIANATYTSAAQCFNYFRTQTDKMVFNRDYENIITSGLVFNLDAGFVPSYTTSGITWYDLSPNANNGTLTNGPTFDSANGGSILFDGTDDYVDCGNNASIQITGDISILAWIKVTDFSKSRSILGKTNSNVANPYDFFLIITTGVPRFLRGNGTFSALVNGTAAPSTNVWQHVAVTQIGTSVTHYLNGSTNGTGTLSQATTNGANNLMVGNRSDNFPDFKGNISIAQIYNRGLSSAEILQNYNAQKSRYGL